MATRRRSSKAIWMRSGWSSGSICWVFLFWGRFAVSQTIIPEAQEHFLTPSAHRDTHPFGGSGVRLRSAYDDAVMRCQLPQDLPLAGGGDILT